MICTTYFLQLFLQNEILHKFVTHILLVKVIISITPYLIDEDICLCFI